MESEHDSVRNQLKIKFVSSVSLLHVNPENLN